MRIVYTYRDFSHKGGVERIFCEKASALAEMGHDVHIVCSYDDSQRPFAYPLDKRVTVHNLGLEMNYRGKLSLLYDWFRYHRKINKLVTDVLDEIDADIVIATPLWPVSGIFANNRKVVLESHTYRKGMDRRSSSPLLKRIELKHAAKHAATTVCLTNEDAALWNDSRRTDVIPNFTNIEYTGRSSLSRRVCYVGRLDKQKHIDILIDVWHIIAKKHPDWILDIYGDGEEYENLMLQTNMLGLQERVNLCGRTDDVATVYRTHDINLLSSEREGLPLVLIEALSSGCPCISTDCLCGPREIIAHGEDGLLVPFRGVPREQVVQGMAEAVRYLIENPEKLRDFSEKARINSMRFDKANIMKRWESLFNEIAG